MSAEYSKNPKNISRDQWEKEMPMKDIILRDAKVCVCGRKCGTFQVFDEKSEICIQEGCVDGGAGTGISILS